MVRISDNDIKALSYLFSTSIGSDAYARIGLDEMQEVANRRCKGAVMDTFTRSFTLERAAVVGGGGLARVLIIMRERSRPDGDFEEEKTKYSYTARLQGRVAVTEAGCVRQGGKS